MTRGARISPTPRRTTCDTPPARVSPTRCVAWGPGAVGIHTTDATNYCDSFHSWAVGIKPPFAEASGDEPPRPNHPRKLHFRGARYRGTPPQRGTLFRDGMRVSSHIRRKGGLCSATGTCQCPPHPVGAGGVAPCATGGGVSGYLLLVTRDKPPFAEASGDRPPRHFVPPLRRGELVTFPLRAPLRRGELRPRCCGVIKKSRGAGFTDGR